MLEETECKEKPYEYSDTPDGQDISKKLKCVMVPTTKWALGIGLTDVIFNSKPKGYLRVLMRIAYVASPFMLAGASFVLVTNGLAVYRKKDDKLNWFSGGFVAGAVSCLWAKQHMTRFNTGLFIGFVTFIKKYALEQKHILVPETRYKEHFTYDGTFTKNRPGNWTTSE